MRVEISLGFVVSLRPKGAAFGQAGSTRLDSSLESKLAAGGAMKLPTSSACSPKPEPDPAPIPPSSHQRGPRLPLVSPPYLCGSNFLCGQPALRRSLSPPQPGRRPSTARPPPFAHAFRACQSPPSPVQEGLDYTFPTTSTSGDWPV